MTGNGVIDIGSRGAWRPEGLKRLDDAVIDLAQHHAETKNGAQALRWHLLALVTDEPTPPPFDDLEKLLEEAESSWWRHFDKQLRSRKGHLDDREVGRLLGYETDAPVRRREWKKLREVVFDRIGLDFGPQPDGTREAASSFDIGGGEAGWRYDVIRSLDPRLRTLADHHAATDVGAQTLRWHVWSELVAAPRPITVAEIEDQLEAADESLLAEIGPELRRAKGHLGDEAVARLLGFGSKRPIAEGYYRQLREDVFGRIAHGFGAVDMPEVSPNVNAYEVGRQGAWKKESLARLDERLLELARGYAKTRDGAQTLRWHYLDQITSDPEPVDLAAVEQRLKRLNGTILDLFGALRSRDKVFLADARIARFVGLRSVKTLTPKEWDPMRTRVVERVGPGVFVEAPASS